MTYIEIIIPHRWHCLLSFNEVYSEHVIRTHLRPHIEINVPESWSIICMALSLTLIRIQCLPIMLDVWGIEKTWKGSDPNLLLWQKSSRGSNLVGTISASSVTQGLSKCDINDQTFHLLATVLFQTICCISSSCPEFFNRRITCC